MKKLVLAATMLLSIAAVTPALAKDKYGKKFSTAKTMTVKSFNNTMATQSEVDNVVVEGKIAQVCQAEGCWLKLKNETGEDILVKFKDHSFTIPKDLAGKTVVVNGKAVKKTISIDERRHMAEDAGASEAEIAKITEPKDEVRIIATGVVID